MPPDRPLVAIVNEALVRRSFGGENPIGRTIFCTFDRPDPMTIVGVVGDVRQRNPAIEPGPECYMPYLQHGYNSNTLNVVVRTAGDPPRSREPSGALRPRFRPMCRSPSPRWKRRFPKGVEDPRFRALLFGLFAGSRSVLRWPASTALWPTRLSSDRTRSAYGWRLARTAMSVLRLILGQGLVLAVPVWPSVSPARLRPRAARDRAV